KVVLPFDRSGVWSPDLETAIDGRDEETSVRRPVGPLDALELSGPAQLVEDLRAEVPHGTECGERPANPELSTLRTFLPHRDGATLVPDVVRIARRRVFGLAPPAATLHREGVPRD